MSTNVESMDDAHGDARGETDAPIALRTPLYPLTAALGLVIACAVFLSWATANHVDDASGGVSVTGLDAGGWGAAALVCGLAIAALGVLGYFWNPFSDPEAAFVALFAAVACAGAISKIADPGSLFSSSEAYFDYFATGGSAGVGLWVILAAGLVSLVSALWILYSRPRAQAQLV